MQRQAYYLLICMVNDLKIDAQVERVLEGKEISMSV